MAATCGLCPCCYTRIERDEAETLDPEATAVLHEALPTLSDLLRQGRGQTSFEARMAEVEEMAPADRAIEMTRIRLELRWIDGESDD
jgi:hypothetical protein